METKEPVKLYKSNLTLKTDWKPLAQVDLIEESIKILKLLKSSPRQEITKFELHIFFKYLNGNVLEKLLIDLVKDGLITEPELYMLYIQEPEQEQHAHDTVVYYLTSKGEKHLKGKWGLYFKEPENIITVIKHIVLPIITGVLGFLIKWYIGC